MTMIMSIQMMKFMHKILLNYVIKRVFRIKIVLPFPILAMNVELKKIEMLLKNHVIIEQFVRKF